MVRSVNVGELELDDSLIDVPGFRFDAAQIAERIGAERIGAAVYRADPGVPIWPYHYHHGSEEWLYVIEGGPVLREPAGERTLRTGDIVCFPTGPVGAHTVKGPGRFVMLSVDSKPRTAVYPDSDKVSNPGGLLFPRSAAVEYWFGESPNAPPEDLKIKREPVITTFLPVVNVWDVELQDRHGDVPAGFRNRLAMLGPLLGAERLGASVVAFDPGEGTAPYHCEYGREEWVLVLAGTPSLRHPSGADQLAAGDVVCFPHGPAGAHRLTNPGDDTARVLFLSTKEIPSNVFYPDSGKWLLRNGVPGESVMLRAADAVEYWDGEV